MKFYYTAIKALVILSSVFSFNLLYGGDDEFTVTVAEKSSGPIKETEICFESIQEILGYRIPSFEVSSSGEASPTFNLDFHYEDVIPPNGTPFEVRALVFTKNASGTFIPVSLTNAYQGSMYALGTNGTIQNGTISLSVTPVFNVSSNCEYYFRFWLVDTTPHSPGGILGGGFSENNQGGSSISSNYSLVSPNLRMTKDVRGCIRYSQVVCFSEYDGNPTNPNRVGTSDQAPVLSVFPNPTQENKVILSLDFNGVESSDLKIDVLTIQGQVLKSELSKLDRSKSTYRQKLDLQGLPAGIYLIRVNTGNQSLIQKLVIQ